MATGLAYGMRSDRSVLSLYRSFSTWADWTWRRGRTSCGRSRTPLRARRAFGQKCRGYANRQSVGEQTCIPLGWRPTNPLASLHAKGSEPERSIW